MKRKVKTDIVDSAVFAQVTDWRLGEGVESVEGGGGGERRQTDILTCAWLMLD